MFVRVSPGEQERLRHEREQCLRQRRLQQIRQADRVLAQKRLSAVRQSAAEQLRVTCAAELTARSRELNETIATVKQQLATAMSFVGLSYTEAARYAHLKAEQRLVEQEQSKQLKAVQDARFVDAITKRREEEERATAAGVASAERLHGIRTAEMQHERTVAQTYRAQHPASSIQQDSTELPVSHPLQQHNYLRRVTYQHGRTRYDDTYHHRDYMAVRGDVAPDTTATPAASALDAAARVAAETELSLAEQTARRHQQSMDAAARHHTAMHGIRMDKERDRMLATLAQVTKMDVQRKNVINEWVAGRQRYPAVPPTVAEARQSMLTRVFESRFPQAAAHAHGHNER